MSKPKPSESQDALPELEKTTVNLSWEAFRELIELPRPEDVEPQPPVECVVKRATYAGEVVGDHAEITATFEVEVFVDRWVNAPLIPSEGIALRSARVDKKNVVLAVHEGFYSLALEKKGTYGITLEFSAVLSDPDSRSGLALNLLGVAVSTIDIKVPGSDLEMSVDPGYGVALETGKKTARISAALGATENVTVDWRPKDDAPEVRQVPLVSTDALIAASIADRVLTLQATITLSVQRAPIDSISVWLPEKVNFLAAEGSIVRDWEPEGKGAERRARIRFQYAVTGTHQIVLRAELPFGKDEAVSVPALVFGWDKALAKAWADGKDDAPRGTPENIERQTGTLALAAEARTEVKVNKSQNLVPVDVKELPGPLAALSALYAFRYSRVPWSLELGVATHDDLAVLVATIDHAHVETIVLEDGRTLSKAYLDVRNNSRQYVRVHLPQGAKLWSSFRSERPVKPATDADGLVRIPLAKPGEGTPFTVELAWFVQAPPFGVGGAREIPLPRFDLPVSFYSAQLYLPRRYRHYNFEGGVKRVEGLSRAFPFRGAIEGDGSGSFAPTNMMAQSFQRPPSAAGGGEAPGSSSGQLPIRIPMLRRGLEARFERTLVVEESMSIKWECKRRKTDVV